MGGRTGIYRFQVLMPPDGDNEFRPVPRRMGGVTIGSGLVVVDAYVDFRCPFCKMFQDARGRRSSASSRT